MPVNRAWDYEWHKDPKKRAEVAKDAAEKAERLKRLAKKVAPAKRKKEK